MLLTNLKRVVADVAAIDEKLIAMAALSPSEDKPVIMHTGPTTA